MHLLANFHIPVAGKKEKLEYSFDEVTYTDLDAKATKALIQKYNAEGQARFKLISKQYHKREAKVKQRAGSKS